METASKTDTGIIVVPVHTYRHGNINIYLEIKQGTAEVTQ